MTRSAAPHGSSPSRRRALALVALGLAIPPLAGSLACSQVRYTESFAPEGVIERVVVRTDAGVVELSAGDQVRVRRAIRAPEAALDLSHRVEDGTLYLEAHCRRLLPCAVDTRVELPADLPVEVDLGTGEVWATGLTSLNLELDEGNADVDVAGDLSASIGSGRIRAHLSAGADARIGIGDGDIEVDVPEGSWSVQADTDRLKLVDITPVSDGVGHLDLTAPAGAVTVRGTAGVAAR